MGVARWNISRRGSRLEVDLALDAPMSQSELDDLCEAVEPELHENVREVVLDGEVTRIPLARSELVRIVRRVGRLALRYGKPFSVRPI
jgi:hypothetical protein